MMKRHQTTSRRQGGSREAGAERSRSAALRAEEYEPHGRPSAGTSQHHMTKSSFSLRAVNAAVVQREGLILTRGDPAGRRPRAGRPAAVRARETASVEPGEKSAEAIVVEENEPESVTLSKEAGGSHFDEGLNVNREGRDSDPGTSKLRRLKSDQTEPWCGAARIRSLMT